MVSKYWQMRRRVEGEELTPDMVRRLNEHRRKPERYCTKCDTELRSPAWKWMLGLSATAVVALIAWEFGWLLIIPFGPIGSLLDAGLRKLRRADYRRGYEAGLAAAEKNGGHHGSPAR